MNDLCMIYDTLDWYSIDFDLFLSMNKFDWFKPVYRWS